MRVTATLFTLVLAFSATRAAADSRAFQLDHLELAITSTEFLAVEGARMERPRSFHVGLAYRYLDQPLLGSDPTGGRAFIGSRSAADFVAGVAPARFLSLAIDVPLLLAQAGEAGTPLVGDLRVAARVQAFESSGFGAALVLAARVPTGAADHFFGEGSTVGEPALAAEWSSGRVRAAVNVGARLRDTKQYGDLVVGHELFAAAAVAVHPIAWLDLFGEAHADVPLGRPASSMTSPVEALAGAGMRIGDFEGRTAVGMALDDGFGAPRFRVLAMVAWAPRGTSPRRAAPPPPPAPPSVEPAPAIVPDDDEDHDDDEQPDEPAAPVIELSRSILFDQDRAHIHARFRDELAVLSREILASPNIRAIWIEGYTDATGPDDWNLELSRLRAERVARFLELQGVPPERLRIVGEGANSPRGSNRTSEGRAANRRVELRAEVADAKHDPKTIASASAGHHPTASSSALSP